MTVQRIERRTGSTRLREWSAARTHPHTYPGSHPDGGFVIVDDEVHPLTWDAAPSGDRWAGLRVGVSALDDILAARKLPALADRIPVLAYGGNRNPATLDLKLRHYGYESPGEGVVLPVLTGTLRGFDVVAAGLSGQGYLYADLYADATTQETELAVHVLLLDRDQLRAVHDSEGVRSGLYGVAVVNGLELDDGPAAHGPCDVLAYVTEGPVFVSPTLHTVVSFSAVRATGRTLPAFDATQMLTHALTTLDLLTEVGRVVGADADATPEDIAVEMMKYLNGQWWFRQHTGQRRLAACERLESLVQARLERASRRLLLPDRLGSRGTLLTIDDAYDHRPSDSVRPVPTADPGF